MVPVVAFDTLRFSETLTAGGFSPLQAKAVAQAFADATGQELATKADLREVRADIREVKADIAAVRAETRESELRLEAKLGEVKADILKWVVGLLLAQAAVIAALVKLL